MRGSAMGWIILALIPCMGWAQVGEKPEGWGYGFFAPGVFTPGTTSSLHFGVGGEGLVYKGLGVGGELGYLAPTRASSLGIGVASLDGSYHFLTRSPEQKVVPFVTGGYTLGFRSGTANFLNYGGGVQYWFSRRLALRLEFRDHVHVTGGVAHGLGFRVGVAFR